MRTRPKRRVFVLLVVMLVLDRTPIGVRVFELDLPQTQHYKKARVRDVFGGLPAHAEGVPYAITISESALRGRGQVSNAR
jgi:hypothetical protein